MELVYASPWWTTLWLCLVLALIGQIAYNIVVMRIKLRRMDVEEAAINKDKEG